MLVCRSRWAQDGTCGQGCCIGGVYPESLHAVTLRPVPLDDKLPEVQEENVPTVETPPGHFHLESHEGGAVPISPIIHHLFPTLSLPLTPPRPLLSTRLGGGIGGHALGPW